MPKYPPNYLADVVAAVADLGRARAFGGAVRGEVGVVLAEGAPASRRDCGNINLIAAYIVTKHGSLQTPMLRSKSDASFQGRRFDPTTAFVSSSDYPILT